MYKRNGEFCSRRVEGTRGGSLHGGTASIGGLSLMVSLLPEDEKKNTVKQRLDLPHAYGVVCG